MSLEKMHKHLEEDARIPYRPTSGIFLNFKLKQFLATIKGFIYDKKTLLLI